LEFHPSAADQLSQLHPSMKDKPGLLTVSITESARAVIARESLRSLDGSETGGILLGTDSPEGIVIRHAGGPGPNARRSSCTFLRDRDHAQQLADAAWRRDRSQWIGEWHTHPSSELIPSDLDLDSYRHHLHDPDLELDHFVALIVGLHTNRGITVATWLVDRRHAWNIRLRQC
jgi:integrative and conjugative element protein (TIGR02256 family)